MTSVKEVSCSLCRSKLSHYIIWLDVDSAADLTNMVQQMLNSMQTRFGEMNKSIVDRIDQMGGKIDELENSI